jgi:hypothetical protein
MKLIGKSVLVLMLGVLVLASAASAGYISSVGGAQSISTNGAGAGTSAGTLVYDDTGLTSLIGLTTTPGTLSDVLTETIQVHVKVPSGSIGDATAGFTTNSAQTTKQPLSAVVFNPGAYVSTTLDGAVSAAVYKTSVGGDASADAVMGAQSGADFGTQARGGTAYLQALVTMNQGLGSVLAEANGTASHDSVLGTGPLGAGYSEGFAMGDAKAYGSNAANQASGTIAAFSNNYAGTYFNPQSGAGEGINYEQVTLNANRGPSFFGDSEAAAYLNGGWESGETRSSGSTPASNAIIDNEATSTMNANASALNARDSGTVNLNVLSETGTDGIQATSDSILSGTSVVSRDLIGSSQKAVGQGFITDATWIASTTLEPNLPIPTKRASVIGSTGVINDSMGKPSSLTGVGVGSWIMGPAIAAQSASVDQLQLATSDQTASVATQIPDSAFLLGGLYSDPNIAFDATTLVANLLSLPGTAAQNQELYRMRLNGRPVTGVTNDAVGAYLGVGIQTLDSLDNTIPFEFTGNVAAQNGIEWLEGKNPSFLPGAYSTNLIPVGIAQTATSRTSGLIGI